MAAVLARLFAIAALLLMPLGMESMSAAPFTSPSGHHEDMSLAHDPMHGEERHKPTDMSGKAHCAMCIALPAAEMPGPVPAVKAAAPRAVGPGPSFASTEPELSTPPPKRG